jgi:hypothetical protein
MSDEQVVFENDRVRVSRVTVQPGARHEGKQRGDRVVVHLSEAHQVRKQDGGQGETISHKAGDAVWREASRAEIQNTGEQAIEIVIVELK